MSLPVVAAMLVDVTCACRQDTRIDFITFTSISNSPWPSLIKGPCCALRAPTWNTPAYLHLSENLPGVLLRFLAGGYCLSLLYSLFFLFSRFFENRARPSSACTKSMTKKKKHQLQAISLKSRKKVEKWNFRTRVILEKQSKLSEIATPTLHSRIRALLSSSFFFFRFFEYYIHTA